MTGFKSRETKRTQADIRNGWRTSKALSLQLWQYVLRHLRSHIQSGIASIANYRGQNRASNSQCTSRARRSMRQRTSSYDNVGFNKPDSYRCKIIGQRSKRSCWSSIRRVAAVCEKYKEQLAKLGIDYDAILQPARVEFESQRPCAAWIGRNAPGESQTQIIRTERDQETGAEVFTLAWPNKTRRSLYRDCAEFFSAESTSRNRTKALTSRQTTGQTINELRFNDFDVSEEACALFDSIAIPQTDVAQSDAPIRKYPDRIIKQGVNKKGKRRLKFGSTMCQPFTSRSKELEDAQFHDSRDGSGKHWSVSYAASEADATDGQSPGIQH